MDNFDLKPDPKKVKLEIPALEYSYSAGGAGDLFYRLLYTKYLPKPPYTLKSLSPCRAPHALSDCHSHYYCRHDSP